MVGSPEINKSIRKILSPILRNNGFSKVRVRNNWGYHNNKIWVLSIHAVGNYFSQVTGWPPMSITVWLGVFDLSDNAWRKKDLKVDKDGLFIPAEHRCHKRSDLEISYAQNRYQDKLKSPAERERHDIWWIEPNGSNIDEAIENVKKSFLEQGVAWFNAQ